MMPVRRGTAVCFKCRGEPGRCGALPAGEDAFHRTFACAGDEILAVEAEGQKTLSLAKSSLFGLLRYHVWPAISTARNRCQAGLLGLGEILDELGEQPGRVGTQRDDHASMDIEVHRTNGKASRPPRLPGAISVTAGFPPAVFLLAGFLISSSSRSFSRPHGAA